MDYNFDKVIDRRNTNSIKYDFAAERGKPDGLIPMWVADMDFQTVPQVTEALIKTAEHSVFGYSEVKEEYFEAIRKWFSERFGFETQPEWMVKTPGVVFAICMAVRAFTEEEDGILIQTPVYYPFKESIEVNGRRTVTNPLVYSDGRYSIDFVDFEKKITDNNVKMFILCSPHNPVGRVWTEDELTRMGDICLRHGVLVISDEIHCDFVFKGYKHTVFGTIRDEFLINSVTCTSPSKSFNLAGVQVANIFIPDGKLRDRYKKEIMKTGFSQMGIMPLAACQSAYESGGGWIDALNSYLTANLDYVRDFVHTYLEPVRLVEPQGTYLIWLDFNALSLTENELEDLIVNKAGLWIDEGTMFGAEGKGFIRINIACPLETVKTAMNRLKAALSR